MVSGHSNALIRAICQLSPISYLIAMMPVIIYGVHTVYHANTITTNAASYQILTLVFAKIHDVHVYL